MGNHINLIALICAFALRLNFIETVSASKIPTGMYFKLQPRINVKCLLGKYVTKLFSSNLTFKKSYSHIKIDCGIIYHISAGSYAETKLQENVKCIPDYAGPCYEDDECCTNHCSNFICRPSMEVKLKENEKCIPDYAGPCYEDSECCTNHCSNFICRPPAVANLDENEKCIPDYAGPCYEDSECCTSHCSNFICRP